MDPFLHLLEKPQQPLRVIAVVLSQKVPKSEKHWNLLGPKQKSALKLYDELRKNAGFDGWDIVYHLNNGGENPNSRYRMFPAGKKN